MNAQREYPNQPICGVGAVIINQGSVLLIRRGQPPRFGEWSIPGGAVELGETIEDATCREVSEECGITISIEKIADVVDIIQKDGEGRVQYHYVLVDFRAEYAGGELQAMSDVSEAVWVPAEQLDKYPMNPQTRHVIYRVLQE